MKRIVVALAAVVLIGLSHGQPVQADVNVQINVPTLPLPIPPPLILPAPPEFIFPPALGFYTAVGVPYDLFRVGKRYYLYRDNYWYVGSYYNGPWRHVERRHLPPGLRKHKFERIRHYRDEEYRHYQRGEDQYRGRRFKPDKEWKEERKEERHIEKKRHKEEKRAEKAERRRDKEERKGEKGEGRGHGRSGDRD